MPNDPDPIPVGTAGTVNAVIGGPFGQIQVTWDNGRTLALIPGMDRFAVIEPAAEAAEPDSPTPVTVPRAVYEGLEAARSEGVFTMLDWHAMAGLASRLGFDDAADWLTDRRNHATYAQGIFRGFKAEE